MEKALRHLGLVLLLIELAPIFVVTTATATDNEEGILVGRISHVEGKLLRYVEKEKDWVVTVKDSPFGLEDALYSEEDSRAEFTLPNRTWLRIGGNSQIQLIDLNPDATTVDVGSGLARLYNRQDDTFIKATTPYGYVVASGDTVFDLYVGDESMEVIAMRGTVEFVHERSDTRYEVRSGSFSIIADHTETARGSGTVDAEWDDWNGERDAVWDKRLRGKNYSAGHVPEPLRDDAHVLDETGRWERVHYDGEYRQMWRPIRVEHGWRPFTEGRWVSYYGDHCWIPNEPFGYITHHYGSWIYVEPRRSWYWVPPVTRVVASTPRFYLRFGWYPGRVSWIHRNTFVGWVPLAPWERYYCHRPWGHRTVVVNPAVSVDVNINLASFSFINYAVVVDHDHFFRGIRYTPFTHKVGRDVIINNYSPVTVINNTVINNYYKNNRRFAYNDVEVFRKPHGSVIDRISRNYRIKSEFGGIGKDRIMKDMSRIKASAEPSVKKESRHLLIANKLVDHDKNHNSLDSLSFDRKELKGRERKAADSKITRFSAERGEKTGSKGKGKHSGADKLTLQQDRIHAGREMKSLGLQDVGESKHIRKEDKREQGGGGKKAATEWIMKSPTKDRQEGGRQEQKSSGGKGRGGDVKAAMERGGGKKDGRQEVRGDQEPRESGKRVKQEPGRWHDQVQQAERKGGSRKEEAQNRQQEQPQRQKGGGKQVRQEDIVIAQEHGKKGGGKKD